ncbi:MAG: LacI family DNA-binding transcriptional regulator [Pedococcus sp.]
MDGAKRVSIRDVARVAGVSTTTVSDAVTGRGRISQATRERVNQVADELGYAAHPNARWLRSGRTGAVGLYLPQRTTGWEYYMRLALGAADETFAHQLALTLVPTRPDGPGGPALHLDGVLVSDPVLGSPTVARLAALGVPVVTCERDLTPGTSHAGSVEGDHHAGIRALLDHLSEQGAQRIAVLCPPGDTSYGLDIRAGHAQWCAERGLPELLHDVPFDAPAEAVGSATRAALAVVPHPDAMVVVPEGGVAPCMEVLRGAGLEFPRDLLLASYVDDLFLASLPVPVTAVDLKPALMGQLAARLLADLVEGRAEVGLTLQVPTELHVRASTTR